MVGMVAVMAVMTVVMRSVVAVVRRVVMAAMMAAVVASMMSAVMTTMSAAMTAATRENISGSHGHADADNSHDEQGSRDTNLHNGISVAD